MNTKRKQLYFLATYLLIVFASCTSQEKLAYLNNLPSAATGETFKMDIPDYKIQYRDILSITIKAMMPDGTINDLLASVRSSSISSFGQGEAGQYLIGYDVKSNGEILLPVLGSIKVAGSNLEEARDIVQIEANKHFNNSTVDCKLLSYKFTVIGEVKTPGTFTNFNNYLTVLEAIGRAGGVNDYGRRDKLLVIRLTEDGTKTFNINLQDKSILSSEAYFILPNDVIIVEPESKKIFNLNLPTISFIVSTISSAITTTLLLINFYGK